MQNTGNEIFWAGHNSNSQMRIFSWAEGSNTYFWRDRNVSSWANNAPTSLTPDSKDWLAKNFNGPMGNSFARTASSGRHAPAISSGSAGRPAPMLISRRRTSSWPSSTAAITSTKSSRIRFGTTASPSPIRPWPATPARARLASLWSMEVVARDSRITPSASGGLCHLPHHRQRHWHHPLRRLRLPAPWRPRRPTPATCSRRSGTLLRNPTHATGRRPRPTSLRQLRTTLPRPAIPVPADAAEDPRSPGRESQHLRAPALVMSVQCSAAP